MTGLIEVRIDPAAGKANAVVLLAGLLRRLRDREAAADVDCPGGVTTGAEGTRGGPGPDAGGQISAAGMARQARLLAQEEIVTD
jgi:hypothetical protein